MLSRTLRVCMVAAVAVLVPLAAAFAEKRVALVIGNGAYANVPHLPNPANDAADMAAALRDLGFEVIAATNVDKVTFDRKLREFAGALGGVHTALFYYAGHGIQVANDNYAIPVDAKLDSAAALPVETVNIDEVLAVMQADDNRVSLVFLDACRNNPLTRSFVRKLPATRALSVGNGLSAVDPGRGTLIAFSTAPDKVALDGRGRNSPFTGALLRHIRTPGLDIALILRRVTADVEKASGGAQVPWVHASLTTDVILDPAKGPTAPTPSAAAKGPGADELAWTLLKDTKDAGQLRRFIAQFPDSARRSEVEARIASLSPPSATLAPAAPPPAVTAPNESLPANIRVEAAALRQIESDPFFANAPPVRVRNYSVATIFNSRGAGVESNMDMSNTTTVHWLRPGIIREDTTTESTSTASGTSLRSVTDTTSVAGANGFFMLGSRSTTRNRFGATPVVNKILRFENLSGPLFPLKVGNRMKFDVVSQYETHAGGRRYADTYTQKNSCEVTKRYDAKSFHSDLTGGAFLLHCNYRTLYRKNKSGNSESQSNIFFFDGLGVWIAVDPILPRERVVTNGVVSTTGNYTTVSTGTYTLRSFSLAR